MHGNGVIAPFVASALCRWFESWLVLASTTKVESEELLSPVVRKTGVVGGAKMLGRVKSSPVFIGMV
jgi:hypothetical protein